MAAIAALNPRRWGIPARSAAVAAAVVAIALIIAGIGTAMVLARSLIGGIDDAAAGRVRDITAALQFDAASDLDASLMATDQRISLVQVIASDGRVVTRSSSAPDTPMAPLPQFNAALRRGVGAMDADEDIRVAGETVGSPGGRYTVLVGGDIETVEMTVRTVGLLLTAAAPIVIGVAAGATYLLVARSLRSVEAIRARVETISTSDLSERVPVPATRDVISALALTMNEMLARIESGHAAQRRFVGDASHELRSPLASLISALEVAEAHPELWNTDVTQSALLPEAQRMQALIDDLLLLARADEKGGSFRKEDVDLDDIAATEATRLRRDTALTVEVDLAPARLTGDASALARVVRNLVDNASRHAASTVEITVAANVTDAILSIGDDGPGIPAGDRERIFGRFVRLDYDRSRASGGSGLGLAIVAEIIAGHRGTVRIDDRPEGGTLVIVQLPLVSSEDSSR